MFVINIISFSLIVFHIIEQNHCLVELPFVEDNNIIKTAAIIRNTTNKIFSNLKLKEVKNNQKLKQYSSVHNYLISLTLQDYNNLKEIVKLTRVNDKNNTEVNFIPIINEVLYEYGVKNKNITIEDSDENVVKHIELFLNTLESYKTLYKVNDVNIGINNDILQYFDNEVPYDDSRAIRKEENDVVLDDIEYWNPEQSGRRIYKGKTTKVKYFPFVSSIEIFRKFQCAGSIIKSDLIITASSCLQLAWNNRFFRENPAFLSARVGSNFYESGGESIPVLEVYFHPSYDPKTLTNNISILRLIRRIHFGKNKHVKKINFDREESSLPMTINGVTIVGWGSKEPSNIIHDPWRNRISFATLDVYPLNECQEIYSREYVSKKNFCAGFVSKGGGACNRDVGGPGIAGGKLIGVISFGSPVCGTPDIPTVFTKLGYYTDWIEDIMAQDVPRIKKRTTTTTSSIQTEPNPYTPGESTTFKIEPIIGKMKPIPINNRPKVENLREVDNGDSFKDFLKTVFISKELEQYQDLIDNAEDQSIQESAIEKPSKARHVPEDDSEEDDVIAETEKYIKYTIMDEISNAQEKGLERDIVNLIENLDLNDIVENGKSADVPLETNSLLKMLQNPPSSIKSNVDDAILTLLYLSDDEAKNINNPGPSAVIVDDNNDSGLSIAVDGEDKFKDLTYRNNGSDLIDFYNSRLNYLDT